MKDIIAVIALLSTTSVFAGNWGEMTWGEDVWGTDDVDTPISPSIVIKGVERFYGVNDVLNVDIEQTCSESLSNVDLWLAVQLPNDAFLFRTPLLNFSNIPQLAAEAINKTTYPFINELTVPRGIGGDYTLYAACVEEGGNPITDGFSVIINMDVKDTTLAND